MFAHTLTETNLFGSDTIIWKMETIRINETSYGEIRGYNKFGDYKCLRADQCWFSHDYFQNYYVSPTDAMIIVEWQYKLSYVTFEKPEVKKQIPFINASKYSRPCPHGSQIGSCGKAACKREYRRIMAIVANENTFIDFMNKDIDPIAFGYAFGVILSPFVRKLIKFINEGWKIALLARDCEGIYYSLCQLGYAKQCIYLRGINRTAATKLQELENVDQYLDQLGISDKTHILIDSGFSGTIPSKLEWDGSKCFLISSDSYTYKALIPELNDRVIREAIVALEHSIKLEISYWTGKPDYMINPPELAEYREVYRIYLNAMFTGISNNVQNELNHNDLIPYIDYVTKFNVKGD